MKREYWKIIDTLRLIKIAKEDNKDGIIEKATITKDYINHLSTNINLMRESAEFTKKEIIKLIEEFLTPNRKSKGYVEFRELEELLSKIKTNYESL